VEVALVQQHARVTRCLLTPLYLQGNTVVICLSASYSLALPSSSFSLQRQLLGTLLVVIAEIKILNTFDIPVDPFLLKEYPCTGHLG